MQVHLEGKKRKKKKTPKTPINHAPPKTIFPPDKKEKERFVL